MGLQAEDGARVASSRMVVEKRVRCTGERVKWAGEKRTV